MPTYEYACNSCGHQFDVVQSFSDDALTICPECGGALRKVFGSVGIVFKGSGFYKTDSRGSKSSTTPSSTAAKSSEASAGESTATETKKPEKKETPAAPSSPAASD
jgi:putative FmdB family regulatory protein